MIEKLTVLKQPHRLGDTDQRLESPLGRFVVRNKLRPELYDAGIEYGGLVRHFYHAKGVQIDFSEGRRFRARRQAWNGKVVGGRLERIEPPLQRIDPVGFSALRTLCVHEREIAPEAEPMAIVILCELGALLRKTGRHC